jgi:hypothetical protein
MWIASISIEPFAPFEPFSVDAAWGMVSSSFGAVFLD